MKKLFENIGKTEIRNIIAVLYVVAVLGYIYLLAWHPVPSENKDLVNIIGGSVIGSLSLILSFFFGASKNNPSDPKKPS